MSLNPKLIFITTGLLCPSLLIDKEVSSVERVSCYQATGFPEFDAALFLFLGDTDDNKNSRGISTLVVL